MNIFNPQLFFKDLISLILSEVAPKKKLKFTKLVLAALSNLLVNNFELIVAGFVFGISKNVVIPPAAQAIEPDCISSL